MCAFALALPACGGGGGIGEDQAATSTATPAPASVDDPVFVIDIENGAFRPSQVTLGPDDSGLVEFQNRDSDSYDIVAADDEFGPVTVTSGGSARVDFATIGPGLIRYSITVGNLRIPGSVDNRSLGGAPSAAPPDSGAPATIPEAAGVVVGDREVTLDSFGCVGSGHPELVGFGEDANGTWHAVRVEEFVAHVSEIGADAAFAATSGFAPTWSGGHVEGAGEFLTQDGQRIPGAFQAICATVVPGSTTIELETGEVHELGGPVCVASTAGFTFLGGPFIEGAQLTGEGVVPYMRRLGAPESLIEDAIDADLIFEHLFVGTSGVQPGLIGGVAVALLDPSDDGGLFETALPASAFSVAADLDYQDTIRANPRLSPEFIDTVVEALGDESTVTIDIECAVKLDGPELATARDLP